MEYFAAFGIEGYPLPGLSKDAATGEELYATSLLGMDDVSSIDVYRHCRAGIAALDVKVDALYLNGGGWDAAPALEYLEADLKIPTLWAIAAEMWYTYQRMGIAHVPEGFGRLLRDNPDPVEHAW